MSKRRSVSFEIFRWSLDSGAWRAENIDMKRKKNNEGKKLNVYLVIYVEIPLESLIVDLLMDIVAVDLLWQHVLLIY